MISRTTVNGLTDRIVFLSLTSESFEDEVFLKALRKALSSKTSKITIEHEGVSTEFAYADNSSEGNSDCPF